MKIGSLFTGYGGLDMAVAQVTGGQTVWVSDVDKGANKILAHRYPDVPNLGDITAIDFSNVEPVDILTGGFPCQDLSHAGKRVGLKEGTRSGLWSHMARAIKELNPRLVVVENVRGLLSADAPGDVEPCPWCVGEAPTVNLRALGVVLADLADIGYDAQWCGLRAADVGACHGRFRVFLIAHPADTEHIGHERPVESRQRTGLSAELARPAQDTDSTIGGERWLPAPRQEAGGRPRADVGRPDREGTDGLSLLPTPMAAEGTKPSNTMGVERRKATGEVFLTNVIVSQFGDDPHDATPIPAHGTWGDYAPAIARWEAVIGRPAPSPTEPTGRDGKGRLSPAFVEWMMGLPSGWITDVPELSRAEQLKALGNGVVPQQASAALVHLLGRSS